MTKLIKGALYRVIGNKPSNSAGEHRWSIGEIVRFVECDSDGDYRFAKLDGSDYQWILPKDVVPVDAGESSLLTELEAITTEVAALRTRIKAALAVKLRAEEVFKLAERPVPKVGDLYRVMVDGESEAASCWFCYKPGDIVEIVGYVKDDKADFMLRDRPNSAWQTLNFVDLEPCVVPPAVAEPPHVLAHRALMEWAGAEWTVLTDFNDIVGSKTGDAIAATSSSCDFNGHDRALVRLLTAVPDLLELAEAVYAGRHDTATMSDMAKDVLRKAGALA